MDRVKEKLRSEPPGLLMAGIGRERSRGAYGQMCGIAGSHGQVESNVAERMLDRLAHRGPVGSGEMKMAENWLGHRRCTIADVEDGKQPLVTDAGNLAMVEDGEIYNEDELRKGLANARFRTESNAEVALHLFDEKGPDAFAEIDGKFALIIAGQDGRFVVARDSMGNKPLYWATHNSQTLFASELGAFDADWLPAVEFFPPGHYWTQESGLVRFQHTVPRGLEKQDTFDSPSELGAEISEEILSGIRHELVTAVDAQMMDGEDVGVFLSGGLDSSIIAAIVARWYKEHRGENLKTFAVGLGDAPDLQAARTVADYIGSEHYEKIYRIEDALEILPEVVRTLENFDPSLVRSSVSNYMVAELASHHVNVVMIGEGADEIFGGYDYLEDFRKEEELQEELIGGLEVGHNGGLQRVDRMTMAHGLEARMPFLAPGMVELGFSIPASWKHIGKDQPEKRLLRQAFDGWLPDDVLWRKKAQFGEGSGAVTFLTQTMEESVSEDEFERERHAVEPPLRSREEVAYYRIFAEHLPGARPEKTISRFVTL